MKKITALFLLLAISASLLAGCTKAPVTDPIKPDNSSGAPIAPTSDFNTDKLINVVSREDGSGTRGAFIELFKIEVKGDDGTKKDMTTKEAVIASKTDIMLQTVAGDDYSIGYVSLGSLNDTVKALDINDVKASAENVKNGTYKVSRPFNIATKGDPTGVSKDFIDYILSADGQLVVAKSYIAINENAASFVGTKPVGKTVVSGSSSVTPIMEKLREAYLLVNPNAIIEIQQTDSTGGMAATLEGICDIGMASRSLKESELKELTATEIALDGIAVVTSKKNPATKMSDEDIRKIFTGEVTKWNEIVK